MHIEKVNYQKTFNLGNYTSEKIGVEVFLHQGESADKALDVARGLVEEYHKQNLEKHSFVINEEVAPIVIEPRQTGKSLTERTKEFIDLCKTPEELKAWELMSKNNPELLEHYNNKLNTF
jgi:hypothetical protein